MATSNVVGNSSLPDAAKAVFLTPYERKGVIVSVFEYYSIFIYHLQAMGFAGTVSCILVTSLLLTISLPALFSERHRYIETSTPFARKQIAWVLPSKLMTWLISFLRVFVICLLSSDLIQSISGIIQVKWAAENRLFEGTACSIQGDMDI